MKRNSTLLLMFILPTFLMAQHSETKTPEELLKIAAALVEQNKYDALKAYIHPIDKASETQLDIYIQALKLEPEIRSFLKKGSNKFKENFFNESLDLNLFFILRLMSPNFYQEAVANGVITYKNDFALCTYKYAALDNVNEQYEDRISMKKVNDPVVLSFLTQTV